MTEWWTKAHKEMAEKAKLEKESWDKELEENRKRSEEHIAELKKEDCGLAMIVDRHPETHEVIVRFKADDEEKLKKLLDQYTKRTRFTLAVAMLNTWYEKMKIDYVGEDIAVDNER